MCLASSMGVNLRKQKRRSAALPSYFASVMRLGSRGPGRSSGIRQRNQLTAKAWEKAVRELGKTLTTAVQKKSLSASFSTSCFIGMLVHLCSNLTELQEKKLVHKIPRKLFHVTFIWFLSNSTDISSNKIIYMKSQM